MDIPCFYIHTSNSYYLDSIFALTRHFNKNNRIILIGDSDNYEVAKKYNIEHYLITDYNQIIPYHHVSVNTIDYEKFCFNRWFILKNFINTHNIEKFVYSDSDNAIIYDFNSIEYANAFLGHTTVIVPNLLFFCKETLQRICVYYLELYNLNYENFLSLIKNSQYMTYHNNNINNPHFSDMMFLKMAIDFLNINYIFLPESRDKNTDFCYNSNINDINPKIINDKVYLENTNIFLLNIHFAGSAKTLVKEYLSLIL